MKALDSRPLVLNVDDNSTARFAVSTLLRREGFDVMEASSGEEALSRMDLKPDIVLLDVHLGSELDGLEVCRRLKANSDTASVPLILISSLCVACEDRVRGLEVGADGYLTKPLDPSEMVAHIKALFRVRQAEKAHRESEQRWRAIIEKSFDCIHLLGPDGIIQYCSPSSAVVLGYPPQEHVGHNAFDLLHPEELVQVREEFERLLRHPGSSVTSIHRGRHRDGSWRWLEARATNLLLEPSVRAVVVNFRDITEQRLTQEQLRQAQKMEAIGRLAGGVAHDFNNLLCIINGYSDLLLQHVRPGDPNHEMLLQIKKAGELSSSLTNQLLTFSRKQVLSLKRLDLNAIIASLGKMLHRVIGEDVKLVTKFAASAAVIDAEPGQMEQVIMNLAVNARDAMPGGGSLTIETADEPSGRHVVLTVEDTGCGMTPEVKARLFEPFFTTKAPGKGTGLGLATIYGIIKQNGGHIEVESEPGCGCRFQIYLPRSGSLQGNTPPQPTLGRLERGCETVLVVEDEDAVRSLTTLVLRQAGYHVLEARDGEAALRTSEAYEGPIDLLVTDVVMPGMGGRQVAEKLSQSRSEIRVLYLSGYTGDAVLLQGVMQNQVNFLQKPFTPKLLTEKVREVLDLNKPDLCVSV